MLATPYERVLLSDKKEVCAVCVLCLLFNALFRREDIMIDTIVSVCLSISDCHDPRLEIFRCQNTNPIEPGTSSFKPGLELSSKLRRCVLRNILHSFDDIIPKLRRMMQRIVSS